MQLAYERELGMPPTRMALKANGTRAALDVVSAMSSSENAETAEIEPNDGGEQEDADGEARGERGADSG